MSLTTATRVIAAAGLLAGLVLAVPAPANALSCVDPERVYADADTAFTGRITDAEDGLITVAVDEIWKGGPLLESVVLKTELDGWWTIPERDSSGSIPEGYHSTKPWLFAPRKNARNQSVVNPCTAWSSTAPSGTDLRPTSVTRPEQAQPPETPTINVSAPVTTEEDGTGPARAVLWGVAGVLAASVVALVLAIRRSRSHSAGA